MQLESQVGFAAETVASRDVTNNTVGDLDEKIHALSLKIDKLTPAASNIYVNSCTSHHPEYRKKSQLIQTDDLSFTCNVCDKIPQSRCNLEAHTESNHEQASFLCKVCDATFGTNDDLSTHIESDHSHTDKSHADNVQADLGKNQVL